MPPRHPQTSSAHARRPPRPARDVSASRGGVPVGGMRTPSRTRRQPSQNRSTPLRETSIGALHPSDARQIVQEDVQQHEQQIEQVLSVLSPEDRRIFGLMAGLLVRQPVVQAHRLLACLAYQSETRRYLAQYGGVSGSAQTNLPDADSGDDDKASLLRELEAYHKKAVERESADAERAAREARRVEWVRQQQQKKLRGTLPSGGGGAAPNKKAGARAASNGRNQAVRQGRTAAPPGAANGTPVKAPPARAVLALANMRSASASSAGSSQASTSSPQVNAKAGVVTPTTRPSPHSFIPPLHQTPPQPRAPATELSHTSTVDATATGTTVAHSRPSDGVLAVGDHRPDTTSPHSQQLADGEGAGELRLHTSWPAPTAAQQPSAQTPPSGRVPVPTTESPEESPTRDNIGNWLFTEQSAPATHAHPTGTAAMNDLDDLFGIDTHQSAPVKPSGAEEIEDELFVPGAAVAEAALSARPAEEPLDATPVAAEDMKMPWDDI